MSMITDKRLAAYDRLMRSASSSASEMKEDALCSGCRYHRRDWDYRFCRFTECRYMKGMKTFREEVYEDG